MEISSTKTSSQRSSIYKMCVLCNKRRIPKSHLLLSKFPLDPVRCRLWVKLVGMEDLIYLPIEKLHQLKYLCSEHFHKDSFNKKGNRLLKTAIPSINLMFPPIPDQMLLDFPYHTMEMQKKMKHFTGLKEITNVVHTKIINTSGTSSSKSPQENKENSNIIAQMEEMPQVVYEPVASSSKASIENTFKVVVHADRPEQNKDEKVAVQSYQRSKKTAVKSDADVKTKNEKKLMKQLVQSKITLKRLVKSKIDFDNVNSEALQSIFSNAVKNSNKKSHGKRWDLKNKIWALNIFKRSPKTYRFMEKIMPLPSTKTLQRLLKNIPIETGIHKAVINILKKKTASMDATDKHCTIAFDEIALKKRVIYNEMRDIVEGFVDFGPGESMGRRDQIADHALVFMLQGIRKKYKQPVAHYFTRGTIPTEKLASIIKNVILELNEAGFKIIGTICDQGPTNVGALNLLKRNCGQSIDDNFFLLNGKIFIIYDIPHLFKSLRNNFFNGGVIKIGGKTGKWQHLREAEERNSNFLNFPKITKNVVNPCYKIKMRVKYAAHAFSNTMAAILKMMACNEEEPRKSEIMQTAIIVEDFDKLFDFTNGPASPKDIKRGLRENVSQKTKHVQKWNYYINLLQQVEFLNEKSNLPLKNVRCIRGFIISLKSLNDIWVKLNREIGLKYLNLRQLNQDSVENLFGVIRQHCSTHQNPTCSHFATALKTTVISGLKSPHSRGSNCEEDANSLMVAYQEIIQPQQQPNQHIVEIVDTIDYPVISIPDKIDLENYETDLTEFENQPIVYVSGFVAAKLANNLSCELCLKSLKIDNPDDNCLYKYISLREWWKDVKSLTYPTKALCEYVNRTKIDFETNIKDNIYIENVCKWCELQLSTMNYDWIKCPNHVQEVKEKLTHTISLLFIRKACKNKNIELEKNE